MSRTPFAGTGPEPKADPPGRAADLGRKRCPCWPAVLAGTACGLLLASGTRILSLAELPPFFLARAPWLVVIACAVLACSRARRFVWGSAAAVWLLFAVVTCTPVTQYGLATLADEDPVGPTDAVAVLSVNIRDDGEPDDPTQNHLDRAYDLVRQGYARRLVVTHLRLRGISYVPAVRCQLRERGLDCALYETEPIASTYGEISGIRRITAREGWQRLIVVTDACHLKRTRALCRKQGLEAALVASRHKYYDWTAPRGRKQRLAAFRDWAYESYRYQENRWKGWL